MAISQQQNNLEYYFNFDTIHYTVIEIGMNNKLGPIVSMHV